MKKEPTREETLEADNRLMKAAEVRFGIVHEALSNSHDRIVVELSQITQERNDLLGKVSQLMGEVERLMRQIPEPEAIEAPADLIRR